MARLAPDDCHHDNTARAIDRFGIMTNEGAKVLEEHWFCLDCGITTETKTYDEEY